MVQLQQVSKLFYKRVAEWIKMKSVPANRYADMDELLRALTLEPDDKLRGDVEDILDVIAKATGEPWDEGLYERAAPRPR